MKYVRFQGQLLARGISTRLGIFQLAYQLKDSAHVSPYDDAALRRNMQWLETHLAAPVILNNREHFRAICWFKDAAREPLERIWALKHLLEEYGYWIDMIKTKNPGNIIYQDGWQVAAKPFRTRQWR